MPLFVQLLGSFIALIAFIATQAGWITATSMLYLALNVVGSGTLATSAVMEEQWGFAVLESVWGRSLPSACSVVSCATGHSGS